MPRILKFSRGQDDGIWAKIEFDRNTDTANPPPVYIWTLDEAKADRAQAIRDFAYALTNRYIEEELADVEVK